MTNENRKLGCFRLLDEVGKDSQGVVYKAVCERDGFEGVAVGTTVALKVLSTLDGDKKPFPKFRARVEELTTLSHPGIVRYFGCFCESGPFGDMHALVTEWLDGEALKDRLRRNSNGLDTDEALRIVEQMLSALAYAALKGVVHRHIEPSNVFFCKDGVVKLIGFERAWVDLSRMTFSASDGPELVALDYMAPDVLEQNFPGDEQTDIFSVGVCLHEMLTGRLPYQPAEGRPSDGDKTLEFLSRWHHVNEGDDLVKIHPLVHRLLVGASDVLAKSLQPQRAERYATFADFAAAFKGVRCRELTHGDNTWRLLQYIGRGGFSEVFKARNVKTGQVVAIKHLQKSQYADWFRREARAMSRLKDPSIVRFISFFEKEMYGFKHAYLVMEYLDGMPGQSLRQVLARSDLKPLPRTLVLRAFARYAHGLSVMHTQELVHRDIKPSNLYFPQESIERAAIMDLAIVRDVNGTMTAGPVPCTLDYAPPEIATSESRGDAGMDIYALGLSLYEALSGKMAYSRLPTGTEGLLAFVKRAKENTRPLLDESSYSDLPDLVRLVREMTEPDVTRRLKDAAEVERRLCILAGVEAVDSIPFDEDADYGPEGFEGLRQNQRKMVEESVNAIFRKRKQQNMLKNILLIVAAVAKMFCWWRPRSKVATQMSGEISDPVTTWTDVSLVTESEDRSDVASEILNPDGKTIINGFHIGRAPLTPAGGRNNVFKAECVEEGCLGLHKGEVVALKFIEETDRLPSFEDFEKSVTYLREIKSPHVPRYYGCFSVVRTVNGKTKRFRMTVMEYLDGADLGYRVRVRSPMFYADEIMYVLDQLLEGLCELAEAGVIHRDIKPSNVFICRDGAVKLIDFDTALIRGIDLCPKNRKIVGTPEFAASDYLTEGFRGDEVSDVFSVGMTLYYMVHGMSPHRAKGTLSGRMDENAFRAVWDKRQKEVRGQAWWKWDEKSGGDWLSGKARTYVPLLGLQRLFERCLTADRNRRFASFSEFRTNLQGIEFVGVLQNDKCLRVISDVQGTSGAGSGYSCVYQRDESGKVIEFGIGNLFFKFIIDRNDKGMSVHDRLSGYLSHRMYDIEAFDPLAPYYPKEFIDAFRASSCSHAIAERIVHEKFSAEKVAVLCKSFADVRPLKEWQREVEHHELQMQLS